MSNVTGMPKSPKFFTIPSRDYGITADEAANVLVSAEEIKKNKPLYKAAVKYLKDTRKAIDEIV